VHHAQNGRVLYVFTLQGKNGRLGIADQAVPGVTSQAGMAAYDP
jgi:hypothetical protein